MISKKFAMIVGGVVGGLTALLGNKTKRGKSSRRRVPETAIDFVELLNEQRTVDNLTAADILNHFDAADVSGDRIVAKPTKKIAEKFGIANLPPEIDTERNLFLLVVRGKILSATLISFGEIDAGLKKLLPFGSSDFVFIDKGGE